MINRKDIHDKKEIKLEDWISPAGLYLDSNGNLVTTALKHNQETNEVSKYRYLYVLSQNGEVINEFELKGVPDKLNSIAFNEEMLIISYDTTFKLIKFQ